MRDLWRSFGRAPHVVHALKDAQLTVDAGEMVVIKGRSGSGKTTLLNLLSGLDTPTRGSLKIDGQELSGLGDWALSRYRNQQIGYVFQAFHLETRRSALANVTAPLLFSSLGRRATRERGMAALERVGLADRARQRAGTLSAGQRQRVALARALINQPRLLLADEPTANLDPSTADQVREMILCLAREHGMTIVWVSHDRDLELPGCRMITVEEGVVSEQAAIPAAPAPEPAPEPTSEEGSDVPA